MSSDVGPVPAWAVPAKRAVHDCLVVAYQVHDVTGDLSAGGAYAAVNWVLRPGSQAAPVTERGEPLTRDMARGESWAALCVAARQDEPTAWDWYRLGVTARPVHAGDPGWCYGAWRALSWLLGVRPDPPLELPVRDAAGAVVPGTERYLTRPNPTSPSWLAGQARRREQETADAARHWRHTRALADRTQAAG